MMDWQKDYEDLQLWLEIAIGELDAMGLELRMSGDMRE